MSRNSKKIYQYRDLDLWPWNARANMTYCIKYVIYRHILRNLCLVSTITKPESWNWKFLRYILPEISYWMRYVMFDLECQSKKSRSRYWYIFFEFRDIDLVLIDTKHKFLRYILPEISYWMRYVMFDLAFQGQRSRSRYRYISFWIPQYRFSTYRHQTQVSTMYTTRDIILNALHHLWPWISRSKVKVTTTGSIFLNSLTST